MITGIFIRLWWPESDMKISHASGNLSKDTGRNKGNKIVSLYIYAIKILISPHKIYAFKIFANKAINKFTPGATGR